MAGTATKLGPGTLVLGAVATPTDFSCQLSAAKVVWDKDKEDDVLTLCDETLAGGTTYTAKLEGTVVQDLGAAASVVEWSWTNKGTAQPFTFIPNTAAGKQVTGTVQVDPLQVGGDDMGKNMTSDFSWDCVGEPVLDDAP